MPEITGPEIAIIVFFFVFVGFVLWLIHGRQ